MTEHAGGHRAGLGNPVSGAALMLSVVDTRTRESHLVAIETAALHHRSGRYPALCGTEVITASHHRTCPGLREMRRPGPPQQGPPSRTEPAAPFVPAVAEGDESMTDEPATGELNWRNRHPLSGTDLTDFVTLGRICGRPDPHIDQVAGQYVEDGRPALPFIADGLAALLESGHVVLGEPDSTSGGRRPVMVTAAGRLGTNNCATNRASRPIPPDGPGR